MGLESVWPAFNKSRSLIVLLFYSTFNNWFSCKWGVIHLSILWPCLLLRYWICLILWRSRGNNNMRCKRLLIRWYTIWWGLSDWWSTRYLNSCCRWYRDNFILISIISSSELSSHCLGKVIYLLLCLTIICLLANHLWLLKQLLESALKWRGAGCVQTIRSAWLRVGTGNLNRLQGR